MDDGDIIDAGYEYDPHTLVARGRAGVAAGMGGIVCSAAEARRCGGSSGPTWPW